MLVLPVQGLRSGGWLQILGISTDGDLTVFSVLQELEHAIGAPGGAHSGERRTA